MNFNRDLAYRMPNGVEVGGHMAGEIANINSLAAPLYRKDIRDGVPSFGTEELFKDAEHGMVYKIGQIGQRILVQSADGRMRGFVGPHDVFYHRSEKITYETIEEVIQKAENMGAEHASGAQLVRDLLLAAGHSSGS